MKNDIEGVDFATNGDTKVRRTWGQLNPVTRIHGEGKQGKKPKYGKGDRHSWKKNISW